MRSSLFQVASRADADGRVLALSGELDLAGIEEFAQHLNDAQAAGGPLTIDLTELDFIDSSGLGILVRFHNAATAANTPYRLIAGPAHVHRAFVLTGLDQTLSFSAP